MEKELFRFYIKTRVILGIRPIDIFQELQTAYGEQAPCQSTVGRWSKLFSDGREDIEDESRSGHQITTHTTANIELVCKVVEDNPHVSYEEIEAETSLSRETIERIIHDSINLRKITSHWIPHFLTDENRVQRVEACRENLAMFQEGKWRLCDILTGDESLIFWRRIGRKSSNACWIGEGEPPKTMVRRNQFEPKTMISVFFKSTGLVLVHCLNKGDTINATSYIENCFKPVVHEIKEQRPTSGTINMKILQDNARQLKVRFHTLNKKD